MFEGNFEFIIVSPYNREKLTCEIWYKNEVVAEISQETDILVLEIYSPSQNKWWEFPLLDFQQALETGKLYLLGKEN